MSLLRLLTSGKSLVGVRDTECRYRLTTQRLLPQFGPAKNPFSSKGKTELALAAQTKEVPQAPSVAVHVNARCPAGILWLRLTAWLRRWRGKPGELLARAPHPTAKPALPHFTRPPLQGELSLDSVRVVRNDLSDTDLGVVPAQRKGAPALPVAESAGPAEGPWGRVTSWLFPAGRTESDTGR